MRILWFTNTPANAVKYFKDTTIGGGWLQALNQLIEDKVELYVAFYNPKGPESFIYSSTTYHSIIPENWKLRLILKSLLNIDTDRDDTEYYLKIIEKVNPDIIHIHGTEKGYINIVPLINIPVLVSIQGVLTVILHKFNTGLRDKLLKNVYHNKGLNYKSILPKSMYSDKNIMKKKARREYKGLQAVQYVAGRTGWDKKITRILAPNAQYFHVDRILKDTFYKEKWEPSNNNNLIIHTTTNPNAYKGFETICEALYELNKQFDRIQWNVAGLSNKDAIVKAAKKQLGTRYPNKGINLLGKSPAKELIQVMKDADMYVMPSHIENSPNNLAEAMILGMPCIATFVGGTPSYLEDGEEGLLVQDGDPWSLAGAILELANDRKKAEMLGANARKRAKIRHDKDKIINDLLTAYQTIINSGA